MKFMEDSIVNFKGFHEEMAKFRSDIRLILQENNYIKERIDSNEKRIDKNEGEILNLRDFKHKHERDYENIVKLLRNDLE